MLRIISAAAALLLMAGTVQAQDWRRSHYHQHYHNQGPGWVGPAIGGLVLGGIIGSMMVPAPAPQPVYVPTCWDEIVGYDVYRRPIVQRVCR